MRFWRFKKKYRDYEINPDEIFIDDVNISDLDQQQFEGVIEKPIPIRSLAILGIVILVALFVLTGQLFSLQVISGDNYFQRSERNRLRSAPLFAERGIIYDRNEKELAWNLPLSEKDFSLREYTELSGHGHILGYVNYPQKDSNGFYWRTEITGLTGIERKYDTLLAGENGAKILEMDALGNQLSDNLTVSPINGQNLTLTLDTFIQHYLYEGIQSQAEKSHFQGGAGIIMDINSGELLAMTSYPEFDSQLLADGQNLDAIRALFADPRKPFLNRALSGLYSPGSTVKPFLALAGLHEGIITKDTKILSTGKIEVPNRFDPKNPSIFRDWRRTGHGLTDVRFALADSVNTFFYILGGGDSTRKGLGIENIEKYTRMFGIAEPTGIDFGNELKGVIPNPEWKQKTFEDGTWRIGDTYITSIGQFGFQVTPIQMARAIAGIANDGFLLKPLLVKNEKIEKIKISENIAREDFDVIQAGLRDTVTKGTAKIVNVPYLEIAAKTGTAEVGVNNEFYNSWIIGFFPYENPQYAFALVMERAPDSSTGSAAQAMRYFLDQTKEHYPEFFESLTGE